MSTPEKVGVVGSRGFPDPDLVVSYVAGLPPGTTVVTGGARGVDEVAERTARECGLPVVVYRPDYARYGRAAPLRRNTDIVVESDRIAAFWDGTSRGTADTIRKARDLGRPVEIFHPRI